MEKINTKLTKLIYSITHHFFQFMIWLYNNRKYVITFFFVFAYCLGLWGIPDEKLPETKLYEIDTWFSPIYLLALENLFVQIPGELSNVKIVAAQFIAYIALLLTVVFALFKEWIISIRLKLLAKVEHTLVIGLGENNRTYLESELNSPNTGSFIIIEPDVANIHAKNFMEKGIGVFWGTLDEYEVQFKDLCHVVISTGNDRSNIEIVGKFIGMIPADMSKKSFGCSTVIHVHLENQDYKSLFQQKIFNSRKDLPLEFKPYSFNDEAARALFEKHTILGNYHTLAQRTTSYNIVIVGEGNLAEQIIYQLCMLANLPNKNHLTIHCVNDNPALFISRLHSDYIGLSEISTVSFEEHQLSLHDKNFYLSDLWKKNNLTNVIICHNDENINLECAVNLHDKVYLEESVQQTMKTKVHFAIYHNLELSRTINENTEEFKQFYTFGDAKKICGREHFIDEKYESIAKLIHYGYAAEYKKDQILSVDDSKKKDEINTKWYDTTNFTKRESNRSQALHINTKLMSLGLKKVKCEELSASELLEHNHKMMDPERKEFTFKVKCEELSDSKLLKCNHKMMEPASKEFTFTDAAILELSKELYSDKKEDQDALNTFFDDVMKSEAMYSKLAKAEHERWNAFHYLNGWVYNKKRDDRIKHHNCLVPFEEFSDIDQRQTIVYDLYSILYIPNYLASTGYRIVPIDDVSIGVTGHRNIKMNDEKLNECLKNELEKVIASHGNIELISPLAEGADRLFVDLAVKVDPKKIKRLTVPMPFSEDDYIQDFTQIGSKVQFKRYLISQVNGIKYLFKVNVFSLLNGDRFQERIPKKSTQNKSFYSYRKSIIKVNLYKKNMFCKVKEKFVLKNEKIQSEFDDKQYEKSGRKVVDKSDILFAIWDGEKANGKGGTARIVDYAISKKKKIVWINPKTYELSTASYPYSCKNGHK